MGADGFFYETSATLPLIKIYQMSLILARSISLDSTFKDDRQIREREECVVIG